MGVGDLASALGLDLNDPAVLAEVHSIVGGPKKPEFVPRTSLQGLAYVIEECGEVILPLQTAIGRVLQAVGKVLRFGWDNHHHLRPDVTNAMQLAKELEDLRAAVELLRGKLWPRGEDELAPGFRRTSSGCPDGGVCYVRDRVCVSTPEGTWTHHLMESQRP